MVTNLIAKNLIWRTEWALPKRFFTRFFFPAYFPELGNEILEIRQKHAELVTICMRKVKSTI